MGKTVIFDIVFMVLLAIVLILIHEFGISEIPIKFLYIPLLVTYFIGRYLTLLAIKKKDSK